MKYAKPNSRTVSKPKAPAPIPESAAAFSPLRVIMRRRWQLLSCLLLVCSVAFAATVLRRPMYEAAARVQVETPRMNPAAAFLGGAGGGDFSTQCELLQSRYVLGRAVEKLHGGNISEVDLEYKIDALRERLKINPLRGSQLIDIVGIADTGREAASIANQVAAAFIEISAETRRAMHDRVKLQMNRQVANYEQEIEALEEQISQYRQEHKIAGSNSDLATALSRIGQIEGRLTQVRLLHAELQAKQERLQKMLTAGKGLSSQQATLPEINADPTVRSLRQTIDDLEQQEMKLTQAYLPGHQKLRDIRAQINRLQTRLIEHKKTLMKVMLEEVAVGLAAAVKQEQDFTEMLNEQKELGVKLTEQQQQYQNLLADLELARRLKAECTSKIWSFTLEEGMDDSPVKVVDAAHAPHQTAGLSKSHQVASILLLGLLFSLGFVFAIDRLSAAPETDQQAVAFPAGGLPLAYWPGGYWPAPINKSAEAAGYDSQPAEKTNEAPQTRVNESLVMGRVGPMSLGAECANEASFAARCRIVHTDQSGAAAGAFRQIVSSLLTRFGPSRQNVVVTGPARQCGKTTCACNLALLLAQAGRKVLLVDAHPDAPMLPRVFAETNDKPGLPEVLRDASRTVPALQQTDVANLTVLGPGRTEQGFEDWQEPDIWALVKNLQMRFDWVIYDAAPLGHRWTQALLQAVGKCVGVIAGDPSEQKMQITRKIEQSGAVVVGLIENHRVKDERVLQEN
ncbi:MAG: hypothetical protein AMJ79_07185 [Phycisphaerae bacterium SM23_30]|nr:MAG: hypothetical protein AMJ79_07185 [Phycisphaerae bacterium SM23_30]